LAYTYEPSIFIEFAHDIGVQAGKAGLINIFVSNGYNTPDMVGLMRDFLDCITVDFKGSGETGFVRKYITIANAEPIFQTLLELRDKTDVHIEITDLIVPEVGDDLGRRRNCLRGFTITLALRRQATFLRSRRCTDSLQSKQSMGQHRLFPELPAHSQAR
jgi:pyruvate formate lyase activating enzyme